LQARRSAIYQVEFAEFNLFYYFILSEYAFIIFCKYSLY